MKKSQFLLFTPGLAATHWDTTEILHQNMNQYVLRGHQLRSEAAHNVLHRFGSAIVNTVSALWTGWKKQRLHQETIQTLSRLDDHVLYDIGIPRSEIQTVADRLISNNQHQVHKEPVIKELGHQAGIVSNQATACNESTARQAVGA